MYTMPAAAVGDHAPAKIPGIVTAHFGAPVAASRALNTPLALDGPLLTNKVFASYEIPALPVNAIGPQIVAPVSAASATISEFSFTTSETYTLFATIRALEGVPARVTDQLGEPGRVVELNAI